MRHERLPLCDLTAAPYSTALTNLGEGEVMGEHGSQPRIMRREGRCQCDTLGMSHARENHVTDR